MALGSVADRKAPDEADSLYLHRGKAYVCENGACRMVSPNEGGAAVIVASEALSDDPGWEKVPVNHMVVIDEAHNVTLRPRD